jgi:hypothetical protein
VEILLAIRPHRGAGDVSAFVDDIDFNFVMPEPATLGVLLLRAPGLRRLWS